MNLTLSQEALVKDAIKGITLIVSTIERMETLAKQSKAGDASAEGMLTVYGILLPLTMDKVNDLLGEVLQDEAVLAETKKQVVEAIKGKEKYLLSALLVGGAFDE